MACSLNFLLKGFHLVGKSCAELVQDIIVDLVVLVVDLCLDSLEADLEASKENEILRSLKSSSTVSDLVEHLIPLVNLGTKFLVNIVFLLFDVPESLIVAPCLHVLVSLGKDFLQLDVD